MSSKEDNTSEKKAPVPEIIQLVNSNDLDGVKTLLLKGEAKVNDIDENGMTTLQHAAYKGQLDMCKLLLEYGADVNANYHDHHYSVLHFAALSGNLEVVKLMLVSGAKTYHTNSLKRTAAQMAGFVGNHDIVASINNYLPISDVQYYTKPQGLVSLPKLSLEVAEPLYNLIMQLNLNPIYIALSVEKNSNLMLFLHETPKVLTLMCEKEVKRRENVNEVICMKFHFLSYVLETLVKELKNNKSKEGDKKADTLEFEVLIKKWLIGRPSDGFEEHLEFYARDALKAFPYPEMPLFLQIVRNVTAKSGESWALDVLHSVINGQKPFEDVFCSTCGVENQAVKKCSKCKSVQYCDRTCQRLHWNNHKKHCQRLLKEWAKKQEMELKRNDDEMMQNLLLNEKNISKMEGDQADKLTSQVIKNDTDTGSKNG